MVDERRFTRELARFFPPPPRSKVVVGIGDDAAVVQPASTKAVLCCDPVVEGVHFDASAPPGRIGHKAVHRNLSDLAAMGAAPDYLLVSLVLPPGFPAARRTALLRGLRSAAAAAGCQVVGGDVTVARGPLVVTVTAVGHLVGRRPLQRDGARPGDRIFVSGALGGARLGRHLRFEAALAEGAWLARHSPPVSACIDVSDGLLLDLATLLQASGGHGAELEAGAIPVHRDARRLSRRSGRAALEHALADGEDHVLLFTARPRPVLPAGGPLTAAARRPIGSVTRRPGLWLRAPGGRRRRLRPEGYQHDL